MERRSWLVGWLTTEERKNENKTFTSQVESLKVKGRKEKMVTIQSKAHTITPIVVIITRGDISNFEKKSGAGLFGGVFLCWLVGSSFGGGKCRRELDDCHFCSAEDAAAAAATLFGWSPASDFAYSQTVTSEGDKEKRKKLQWRHLATAGEGKETHMCFLFRGSLLKLKLKNSLFSGLF